MEGALPQGAAGLWRSSCRIPCQRTIAYTLFGMADASSSERAALVLAADNPAGLARFYGAVLQRRPMPGQSPQHWRLQIPGQMWLEIYQPSRLRPQPRSAGRLALCFQRNADLAALQQWVDQACALGAQCLEPPRQEPFGAEAWLLDPEGNRLLLLVTAA